jgi:hypothetical protein
MSLLLSVVLPLIQSLIAQAPALAKDIGEAMSKGELTADDIAALKKKYGKSYDDL